MLRATHGTRVEEMTRRPRMRPGEGITGTAAAERAPVDDRRARRTSTRASSSFPNLPEDEYESILAVPILARREAGGRAERPHARAARATPRPRSTCCVAIAVAGGAVDRAREALRRGAAARARARGARADLRGRLGVALPRGVARGDREDDDGRASARPAPRSCSRTARSPGPRAAPARTRVRLPLRWKRPADRRARLRPRHAVHRRRPRAARVDRAPRGRRARARARGDARRARPGDPPPRQEQPADRRLAAAAAGARAGASTRARRSRTRSTGSSRSPPCTRC